jgi:DNA-binding PadR family transcriptional regulator
MILKMFGDREFHGYEVHKRLTLHNHRIEISRIYRVLNEMLREGLLEGRWEKSRFGPNKKVYRVGGNGRKELDSILSESIRTVHMFYGKYLMNLAPKVNILDDICNPLIEGLGRKGNLGLVTLQFSPMIENILRHIRGISPGTRMHLVKPMSLSVDLRLEGLTVIDGTYNDIPLRDKLVDLLIVIDLPPGRSLRTTMKQWHRVLNTKGRLAILTPSILVERHNDPLTIGDFVEKHEHEILEQGQKIDKEVLHNLLNQYFRKVQERQIVHMAIFQASQPMTHHDKTEAGRRKQGAEPFL